MPSVLTTISYYTNDIIDSNTENTINTLLLSHRSSFMCKSICLNPVKKHLGFKHH